MPIGPRLSTLLVWGKSATGLPAVRAREAVLTVR